MTTYAIVWAHGPTETGIDTYEEACERVRSVLGDECEIGHDGDVSEGGESTLCWGDAAAAAADDDGLRAACRIRVRHPAAEYGGAT